jgi:hypothetical protein
LTKVNIFSPKAKLRFFNYILEKFLQQIIDTGQKEEKGQGVGSRGENPYK